MKAKTLLLALAIASAVITCGQAQTAVQWQQTLGGSAGEFLTAIRQTSDGGYILGGYSISGVSGNKIAEPFGSHDYWLVKLDSNGVKQWDQSFGSSDSDTLWNLQQTTDGGYILAGEAPSAASGNKSSTGYGAGDWWVIKVNVTGAMQWEKSLGGSANESEVHALLQTPDDGYIIGGLSDSLPSGVKTSPNFGNSDYWLVKLDSIGNREWDKTFGGDGNDSLVRVRRSGDGGYMLAGWSNSGMSGNKTAPGYGNSDYWLVKTDAQGNKQWETCFGGSGSEFLTDMQTSRDGGYILGGYSNSDLSGNKTSPGFGSFDYWVVKVGAGGDKQWERAFGGESEDRLNSLQHCLDGGYIVGGQSASSVSGNKATASFGKTDGWILKLDSQGNTEWEQGFGGSLNDVLSTVEEISDGSYVLGGYSDSGVSGNKTTESFGGFDYWVVKLAPSLRLGSTTLDSNRVFHAQASATPGRSYVFQASTDLTDWTSLLTNRAAENTLNFFDTNAVNFPRRFYRIRQEP